MRTAKLEVINSMATGQVDDLVSNLKKGEARTGVIVAVLSKRMAEDLSDYLTEVRGQTTRYLHSDIRLSERRKIVETFERDGGVIVVVGPLKVLPKTPTVVVMDADGRGPTRSVKALQGLAALATQRVVFCADRFTANMRAVYSLL